MNANVEPIIIAPKLYRTEDGVLVIESGYNERFVKSLGSTGLGIAECARLQSTAELVIDTTYFDEKSPKEIKTDLMKRLLFEDWGSSDDCLHFGRYLAPWKQEITGYTDPEGTFSGQWVARICADHSARSYQVITREAKKTTRNSMSIGLDDVSTERITGTVDEELRKLLVAGSAAFSEGLIGIRNLDPLRNILRSDQEIVDLGFTKTIEPESPYPFNTIRQSRKERENTMNTHYVLNLFQGGWQQVDFIRSIDRNREPYGHDVIFTTRVGEIEQYFNLRDHMIPGNPDAFEPFRSTLCVHEKKDDRGSDESPVPPPPEESPAPRIWDRKRPKVFLTQRAMHAAFCG